jgi:hypothetical protein
MSQRAPLIVRMATDAVPPRRTDFVRLVTLTGSGFGSGVVSGLDSTTSEGASSEP